MSKYDIKDIVENICIVLTVAVIGAFILIAGLMIGSASAHSNRVEHERQFECINLDGKMIYMDSEWICTKKE